MTKSSSVSPDAGSEVRFHAYVTALSEEIGHADRIGPLRAYCTGLLLPGERKSIEPMAARLDPAHVPSLHQTLHHFVAKAPWDDAAVLTAVCEQVLPALTRHGPITAWILDDTGFPKKGTHSVGVTRQYCGQLGKQDNCQVAVSLSLANDGGSLPVAFDLYLPEEWATDPVRRATAGGPKTLVFRTKPQIALEQIRRALACRPVSCWAMPPMASIPHGADRRVLELCPGRALASGHRDPCRPSRARLQRRDAEHQPVSAKDLAFTLPPSAWQTVSWREGSRGDLSGRFATVGVPPSHRDEGGVEPHPEEWLLIEWPAGDQEPSKYWLSSLPAT